MKTEPTTTRRKATPKINAPAEVKRQSKAASKRLAKPAKVKKWTTAQIKEARKILASQNPLVEAQALLQAGGCTGTLVAGRTAAGTDFVYLDPMHRQTRAMARKAMREDAERQKQPEDLRDPGSRRIGA
jgi:hypothetical protein